MEIKIRVWCPSLKKMFYFDLSENGNYFPIYRMTGKLVIKMFPSENFLEIKEPMLWTTKKDKDGEELYEFDIVEFEIHYCNGDFKKTKGVIQFEMDGFLIKTKEKDDRRSLWLACEEGVVKKLGDKFENPELMEASNGNK